MDFRTRYAEFLESLDAIAETHDELTDTEVRERLREVIDYHFVWDRPVGDDFPRCYAMFSDEGDAAVAAAVRAFVIEAAALARDEGIEPGTARHAAIEDPAILTAAGNLYDEYLGSEDEPRAPEPPAPDTLYLSDAEP